MSIEAKTNGNGTATAGFIEMPHGPFLSEEHRLFELAALQMAIISCDGPVSDMSLADRMSAPREGGLLNTQERRKLPAAREAVEYMMGALSAAQRAKQ